MVRRVDVVVVGAGFAGLAAALELEAGGLSVEVVEARDRVGGKVGSVVDQLGHRVDVGGQWVCDEMVNVIGLVDRYGLGVVTPERTGRGVVHPMGSLDVVSDVYESAVGRGGEGSFAQVLGSVTGGLGEVEAAAVRSVAWTVLCQDPAEVAAWHVGAMDRISPIAGEELQRFVPDTMHELAARMAGSLRGRITLGARVVRIDRTATGVTVHTATDEIAADQVIVAVPPQVVTEIDHQPPLPAELVAACRAFRPGDVLKVLVRHDRPLWADAGCDGTIVWADPPGMYATSMTHHAPGLVVFVTGPSLRHLDALTDTDRRNTVLERLADVLGPAAADPASYLEQRWQPDDLGSGGYCSMITTDATDQPIEVIRRGADRLWITSSELATAYPGYIEGAIIAGGTTANTLLTA